MTCKFPASSGYFNFESKPGRSGLALPFQEASERCEPQASEVLMFLPSAASLSSPAGWCEPHVLRT